MKKAILFDMDGTIMYTLDDLTESVNYSLEKLGYKKRSVDEVKSFVGDGIKKLMERALPENKEKLDEAYEIMLDYYHLHAMDKSRPYEGVLYVLNELKKKNLKIGIVTNKNQRAAEGIVEKYFSGIIDTVVGAKKFRKLKPDPEPMLIALKKLGVEREDVIFVGDSEVDIKTAKNSGVSFLGAAWGYKEESFLRENGADRIIENISEIFEYL